MRGVACINVIIGYPTTFEQQKLSAECAIFKYLQDGGDAKAKWLLWNFIEVKGNNLKATSQELGVIKNSGVIFAPFYKLSRNGFAFYILLITMKQ